MGSKYKEDPLAPKPLNLAVIGGGFAGLALTIGLLPHPNIKTTVYESAPAFAEIGVGVAFGPNAVRAMGMISPGILNGFKKHLTGNDAGYPDFKDVWASFRYGMDWKEEGEGEEKKWKYGDLITHLKGTPGALGSMLEEAGINTRSCIHRARFLDELVRLIPEGTTKFGKRLVDIEELVEGGVKLKFADGETVVADAVVGCDGIKSTTRDIMFGKDGKSVKPNFAGEYAYRALVPADIAVETLGDELAKNCQLYVGHRGHIMSYPVEHGKFINIAAARKKDDFKWDHENWIIPSTTENMVKDFEGWGRNIIDLMSRFEMKDKWGFYDMGHEEKYCRGRICLIGDSVHASTPHLGAGAGMAFEDAYILSNLLGTSKDARDLEKAFKCFDETRRKRTQNLIQASKKAGMMNSFLGEGIGSDMDRLRRDIEARYRCVWEFDLEASLVEAKMMLLNL
jgi:salicylate hydroxylase